MRLRAPDQLLVLLLSAAALAAAMLATAPAFAPIP